MLRDAVPAPYAEGAGDSPQSVWLWRTLRTREAAGLDAADESRPLAGAGDVAAVVDGRIRKQADVEHLVPLPEGRRSDRVPQLPGDPALQKHLGQIAAAWD